MDFLFQFLAGLLAFFYSLIPDYAVAIALLTLAVMLLLSPLTLKSTRSMLAMQRLQPEVKRIQQKYKGGDRQQMQQEMMALYKEHQVNPVSGCLPMLVQLPVLFVMYHIIRGLTYVSSEGPKDVCKGPGFDAKYLDQGTRLFQDLCEKSGRKLDFFGMDLARSASQVLQDSFPKALPFILLTGLVAFVQYYQSRQMTRRNPQSAQSPQVQMMTKVMPVMFGVFSFAFPAALNVYWLVSGLFRVGQQGAMYRWDPTLAAHVRERAKEVEAKAKDKPAKPDRAAKGRAPANRAGRDGAGKDRGKKSGTRSDARSSSGGKAKSGKDSQGHSRTGAGKSARGQSNGKGSESSRARNGAARSASRPKGNNSKARKRRAKRGR